MTRVEQAISLGGGFGTVMLALAARAMVGNVAFGVVLIVGFILTFAGKAWAWKHTVYEDGFTDPKFVREES